MEVFVCKEFDGNGYCTFALCKTIDKCKEVCVEHFKHSDEIDSNIELIIKQVDIKDDKFITITFYYNNDEFDITFYISKMPVLE